MTVARMFYQRAAEIGLAQGAMSMAATFDANELSRWTVIGGVQPDPEQARKWYENALALGAADAAARLQRLSAR
jgi:TPR repeat protein